MTTIKLKGPILDNDMAQIYRMFDFQCTCPRDLEEGLEQANGDDITLEVNSPGGYCDYGFEMYALLKSYKGAVEAHIITAASAMTVVCCGADKTYISPAGMYMIHNTSATGSGDYRDMINMSECLQEYNESAINAYALKTGKSREELQEMMDHTTWMSSNKAVEYGFVDGILQDFDTKEEGAPEEVSAKTTNWLSANVMNVATPIIGEATMAKIRDLLERASCETAEKSKEVADFSQNQEEIPQNQEEISKENGDFSQEQEEIAQLNGSNAIADTVTVDHAQKEGGKTDMTLDEFLAENAEAQAEFTSRLEQAHNDGAQAERSRLEGLDAIRAGVSTEMLEKAKYGEEKERMTSAELALFTLTENGLKAANYMADALADVEDAGVDTVGADTSDTEAPVDESAAMAGYINKKHGFLRKED